MDQTEICQHLYQQQLLTDAEYETLLSSTPAGAHERLLITIKKKEIAVFYDFKNTADECPAHIDLYIWHTWKGVKTSSFLAAKLSDVVYSSVSQICL